MYDFTRTNYLKMAQELAVILENNADHQGDTVQAHAEVLIAALLEKLNFEEFRYIKPTSDYIQIKLHPETLRKLDTICLFYNHDRKFVIKELIDNAYANKF